MDVERLNEAFSNFTAASRVLESSYGMLQDRIEKLTAELEAKNRRVRELEVQHERNKRLIAMGEMAAKIVHEIRNPLCSIELYASMLEKDLAHDTHRQLASGISTGIAGLNRILTNMLVFARPHRLNLRPLELGPVIESALAGVKPLAEQRAIKIVQELKPAGIAADAELLKQVFMNIAINAVQAVRDEGTVRVTLEDRGSGVIACVSDDGEGIKPEHLENIFDPFFTTKDTGTGLGLAIASRIMESHGGSISVESREGQGTTFRLLFPPMKDADRGVQTELKAKASLAKTPSSQRNTQAS